MQKKSKIADTQARKTPFGLLLNRPLGLALEQGTVGTVSPPRTRWCHRGPPRTPRAGARPEKQAPEPPRDHRRPPAGVRGGPCPTSDHPRPGTTATDPRGPPRPAPGPQNGASCRPAAARDHQGPPGALNGGPRSSLPAHHALPSGDTLRGSLGPSRRSVGPRVPTFKHLSGGHSWPAARPKSSAGTWSYWPHWGPGATLDLEEFSRPPSRRPGTPLVPEYPPLSTSPGGHSWPAARTASSARTWGYSGRNTGCKLTIFLFALARSPGPTQPRRESPNSGACSSRHPLKDYVLPAYRRAPAPARYLAFPGRLSAGGFGGPVTGLAAAFCAQALSPTRLRGRPGPALVLRLL